MLQHLAELESFCTRLQVLLQRREKQKLEAHDPMRRTSVGGKDSDDNDAVEKDEEAADAEKEAKSTAAAKRAAASAARKTPPAAISISAPDIRDDDDSYFGDEVDVPAELSTLRCRVIKGRSTLVGPLVAQVMPKLACWCVNFFGAKQYQPSMSSEYALNLFPTQDAPPLAAVTPPLHTSHNHNAAPVGAATPRSKTRRTSSGGGVAIGGKMSKLSI